jgi:NADH:ubiquinone reductase (H+-translocating)
MQSEKRGVSMPDRHKVVIVGGGFAGLYAAQALKHAPVEVTLIDKRNFHLFQPLLYQIATGSLSPGEISAPLRAILSKQKNTSVLMGEVVDVDPIAKFVVLKDGAHIPYDSLIAATGSQSSYFGNDAWREWAPSLKSVEDAIAIRHKLLFAFEAAERVHDQPEERREWLTFVIVGAGATGVELAGTLGEIANETLKHDFRYIRPEEAQIFLVDGASRILPAYSESLSRKAEKSLLKLGVRFRPNLRVTGVDGDGITFKTVGEGGAPTEGHIRAKTVIWAAGVTSSAFTGVLAKRTGAETVKGGQIKVNSDLTIPNYPDIYVAGDQAWYLDTKGKPLPGVAQVAMQEGSYAANAIVRKVRHQAPPKPFKYFDKGSLAVIGRGSAIAHVFGVDLSGFLAWLIWLFIHLLYIVEFQSRILVFIQWGFLYLTHSRGARLITGRAADEIPDGSHTMKAAVTGD